MKTAVTVSAALSAGTKPRQSMAWSAASSKHGGGLVRVMKRVLFANKLGRGVRSAMRNRRGSVSAFGSSVHGGKRGLSRSSTVTLTRGRIAPTLVRHVKFDLTARRRACPLARILAAVPFTLAPSSSSCSLARRARGPPCLRRGWRRY